MFLRTAATENFISGSVFNIRGGVGSEQEIVGPPQLPPADEAARPAEPSFLKSPFLYTPTDHSDRVDQTGLVAGEIDADQKQDLLSSVLSKIIQEKMRPGQNTDRAVSSTRDLITFLSLLSLAETEAEPETETHLNPRLYQTEFHEKARPPSGSAGRTEKPYFDTVDVVIGSSGNTPRYRGRPERQFPVPPLRLSGRSGGVGGVESVESVSSPPSFYPQSVSWAPPREQPTDRIEIEKESAEKVIYIHNWFPRTSHQNTISSHYITLHVHL